MVELVAPKTIELHKPFTVSFRSETRVAGRVRLTKGTEALEFTLVREGKEPVTSAGPRVRGKTASFEIREWGTHEAGTELVLRFEAAKLWLTVTEAQPQGWEFPERP